MDSTTIRLIYEGKRRTFHIIKAFVRFSNNLKDYVKKLNYQLDS